MKVTLTADQLARAFEQAKEINETKRLFRVADLALHPSAKIDYLSRKAKIAVASQFSLEPVWLRASAAGKVEKWDFRYGGRTYNVKTTEHLSPRLTYRKRADVHADVHVMTTARLEGPDVYVWGWLPTDELLAVAVPMQLGGVDNDITVHVRNLHPFSSIWDIDQEVWW